MTILIDGDIIAWRIATSIKPDANPYVLYERCNRLIASIFMNTETDYEDFRLFLSGKEKPNFRRLINPEYKANRDKLETPELVFTCKEYLDKTWKAEYIQSYEADDALAWNQTSKTIICTIDKDLDMVPGMHYNFITFKSYAVTELEGLQFFYKQMLIGDTADNIKGVFRIGPVKAAKLIDHLTEEQDMFDVVYNLYKNPQRFVMNAQCLWIQQERGQSWAHRQNLNLASPCKQEVDRMLNFMTSMNLDTSMEPI